MMETNSEDRLLDYIDELQSQKCNLTSENDRLKMKLKRLESSVFTKNVLLICLSIVIILLLIRL